MWNHKSCIFWSSLSVHANRVFYRSLFFISFIFHRLLSHFVGKIAPLLPVCGEVLAQLGLINPIQQKTAATHFDRGELLEKHSIEMFEWLLVLITFQFQNLELQFTETTIYISFVLPIKIWKKNYVSSKVGYFRNFF